MIGLAPHDFGRHPSPRRWLQTLVLLSPLLLGPASAGAQGVASALPPAPLAIELRADWAFHTDRNGIGVEERWFEPDFGDSSWRRIKTGVPWQEQGFRDYAGAAWFRRAVEVPLDWKQVILGFGGLDGEADLYVNGRAKGHFEGRQLESGSAQVDITSDAEPGQRLLLAFRVDNRGGFGGFKQPVMLGATARAVVPPEQMVRDLARQHADWVLPGWASGKPLAWTVVGLPDASRHVYLAPDGSFSPAGRYTVSYWLYDEDRRELAAPQRSRVVPTLHEGLPIAQNWWSSRGVEVKQTLYVGRLRSVTIGPWRLPLLGTIGPWPVPFLDQTIGVGEQNDVVISQVRVQNRGTVNRKLALYVAVQPYGVHGDVAPLRSLEYQPEQQALVVNGQLGVVALRKPEGGGVSSLQAGDISNFAWRGQNGPSLGVQDPEGLASGALRYRLSLFSNDVFELTLAMPLEPVEASPGAARHLRSVDGRKQLAQQTEEWHKLLRGADLHLPDLRLQDAYYASLAYLLLLRDGGILNPGPLSYHDLYYRDATYMAAALERSGLAGQARPTLERMREMQRPDGLFPPIVRADGSAPGPPEYDSQGEGIHALVEYYRFTRDAAWLQASYPAIQRSAQYLQRLRQENRDVAPALRGILPPSYSAEDLGPADWHHYWDDYWALIGLDDAAFAADTLGRAEDAASYRQERASLAEALAASIRVVMRQKSVTAIPNAPEDPDSPRMARASSPLLWPGLLHGFEPELVRSSFQQYYDRFLRPTGGGYRLDDHDYWPYAGMDIAHGFLFLGMKEALWQALDWSITHQTLTEDFAWAEAVNPDDGGLAAGDMPHGWAAASYVSLLRDMILYEDGDTLQIGAGIPPGWIEPRESATGGEATPGEVSVANAPTYFGTGSVRISASLVKEPNAPPEAKPRVASVSVRISGSLSPPAGYRVHSPLKQPPLAAELDGKPVTALRGSVVEAPAGAREVRFHYQ